MIRTLICSAMMLIAAPASAQFYAAFGVGTARIATDAQTGTAGAVTLALGYQVSQHFAAELAASDYGSGAVYSGSRAAPSTTAIDGGSGFGISVVGGWPISSALAVLGKLGAQDLGGHWSGTRNSPTVSNLGWTTAFGVGIQYQLTTQLRARAMLERVAGRGAVDYVQTVTAGLAYSF